MEAQTMAETEQAGAVIRNKVADPSEIEVVNGVSWQCPIYVRKMPPCRSECPSSEDIRGYLTYIAQAETFDREHEESVDEAWHILTDKNPFPAVHGRICPHPCEDGCNRQHKDSSVAINNMERYIGDHGLKRGLKFKKITDKTRDQKVAIIGAGPSGLSCAYQMARRGYPVTVFESAEKAGGMLRYGIPSYRLPEDILDAEIQNVIDLGVELKCGVKIGEDISFEQLKSDYDAVYVAVGAQKGSSMKVEGEDHEKVLSGVDFLKRINTGETVDVGRKVMVVGGGNTAIDAARVSRRLGAEVTILYRRTRNEMPAIAHEIDAAEAEGIKLEILGAPVAIKEGAGGSLEVTCIRMELGEKDSSGRARPEPVEGSEYTVEFDTVIAAVGQQPDLAGMDEIANEWGWIDDKAARTTAVDGVYAGGDVVNLDIATTAVGHGRRAAQVMDASLNNVEMKDMPQVRPIRHDDLRLDYYDEAPRNDEVELPAAERIRSFDEVNRALPAEAAIAEAKRCLSCGLCFLCDQCRVYCPMEAIERDKKRPVGQMMFTDYTKCVGCHICAQACPSGYIEMGLGL